MAINFPNNPTVDDEFTDGNSTVWYCSRSVAVDGHDAWARKISSDGTQPDFSGMPTVSGVPILEGGTNANGNWIKYEDGTLIQWSQISLTGVGDVTWGSLYRSAGTSIPFPLEFDETNIEYSIAGNTEDEDLISTISRMSTTRGMVSIYHNTFMPDNIYTVTWIAIGRWKP